MTSFYNTDLACVHDTAYGHFARGAAELLMQLLSKPSETTPSLVVDLGCGSGIMAERLLSAGINVLGVDCSPAMIELARQRGPGGRFKVGSIGQFAPPPCQAVTAIGEVFNYLFDSSISLDRLTDLWCRVYAALDDGGLLLFDVATPGRSGGQRQAFSEGPDWACLVEYQHDPAARQLARRVIVFRRLGESWRRSEERHVQQLFDPDEIQRRLTAIGFRVERLSGYPGQPFPVGLVGFLARK